jgi:phospholipid transport system substrate-binding protein
VQQVKGIGNRVKTWLWCGVSLTILIASVVVPALAVPEAPGPLTKVKTTIAQAVTVLHDQQMPIDQRRRALQQLAERNLDLHRMAQESLNGHWNEITPAERDEFVTLFAAFIEEAYLTQIQDYIELNIDINKERRVSPDFAEVDATVLQPHEEVLPITFMLERQNDDWLVYDVTVEGVSMVQNYRAQFDRVIKRDGVVRLLNDLRIKQKQLAALIARP